MTKKACALPIASAPNIAVEPTPNSLRSYVASAIGRGSPRAFGFDPRCLSTHKVST
jgi:hypothetical protein